VISRAPRQGAQPYEYYVDIIVTLGIVLDWAPAYFFGIDPQTFSFTKYLVLPLIAMDVIRRPTLYLSARIMWFAFLLGAGLLLGSGGGVFLGTVTAKRLWSLLPIVPVTAYFLTPRSADRIQAILRAAFWSALLVPVSLLLSYFGVIEPSQLSADSDESGAEVVRLLAGTSWSSLGLYCLICASTGGGAFLYATKVGRGFFKAVGFGLVALMGLAAVIITGQRTSPIAYVVGFAIAVVLFGIAVRRRSPWRMIIATGVLAYLAIVFIPNQLEDMSSTFSRRWTRVAESRDLGIKLDREQILEEMLSQVREDPRFFPPGMSRLIERSGNGAHILLGEAYFDGGLPLFVAVVVGVLVSLVSATRMLLRSQTETHRATAVVLIAQLIGSIIVTLLNPALHIRLWWMFTGLWIGSGRMLSQRSGVPQARRLVQRPAVPQPATPNRPQSGPDVLPFHS